MTAPIICLACSKANIELSLFCYSRLILKTFDKKKDGDACGSVNYLTFHCLTNL